MIPVEQFFSQLIRLYSSAIGFLVAIVFALFAVAALAKFVVWLLLLLALLIVLRIVWARTSL